MTKQANGTDDQVLDLHVLLSDVERAAEAAGWSEFAKWARKERAGYGEGEVPDYRKIGGVPMGFVPGTGWVPLFIRDAHERRTVSVHALAHPVKQISAAIAQSVNGKAYIHYPTDKVTALNAKLEKSYNSMATCVDHRQLEELLTAIRQRAARKLVALGVSPDAVRNAAKAHAANRTGRHNGRGIEVGEGHASAFATASQATQDVLEELQLLQDPLTRFGFNANEVAHNAERVRTALETAKDRDELAGPLAQLKLTFAGHPSVIATGLDVRLGRCLDLLR